MFLSDGEVTTITAEVGEMEQGGGHAILDPDVTIRSQKKKIQHNSSPEIYTGKPILKNSSAIQAACC
jgi:hypothetical protein